MKVLCSICSRERKATVCKVFTTTPEEKATLKKMGQTPQEHYYYCRPCFRILENPATAVELMKGVVQAQAQALGAGNAEQAAEKFKARLLARMKMKPVS